MSHETSRRTFLSAAALLATRPGSAATNADHEEGAVRLGMCSYSFGKSKLADALPALKSARVRYINIKPEFHLPYDSSVAQIAEMKKMLDDNGLILVGLARRICRRRTWARSGSGSISTRHWARR